MYGGGKCPQLATHGSEQWLGLKLRKVCRKLPSQSRYRYGLVASQEGLRALRCFQIRLF